MCAGDQGAKKEPGRSGRPCTSVIWICAFSYVRFAVLRGRDLGRGVTLDVVSLWLSIVISALGSSTQVEFALTRP